MEMTALVFCSLANVFSFDILLYSLMKPSLSLELSAFIKVRWFILYINSSLGYEQYLGGHTFELVVS